MSIGVGRLLPGLTGGALWPLRLLGLGYGVVAIAVLVIGAVRQNQVAAALRRGSYEELSTPLVMWLTAAAVALSLATLVVIALRQSEPGVRLHALAVRGVQAALLVERLARFDDVLAERDGHRVVRASA